MPAEIQKCPSCGMAEIDIESCERGIDYVVNEGHYLYCPDCGWESDITFESYEQADEDRRANIKERVRQQPTTGKVTQ